jgi:undecaprenyl-diphosphatase
MPVSPQTGFNQDTLLAVCKVETGEVESDGSNRKLRGGIDMEVVEGTSEKVIPLVKPLTLSRQSIAILVVVAIVLWSSAFLLWWQADIDKAILVSHNQMRTDELAVDAAQFASRYGMAIIVLVNLVYLLFALRNEKLRDAYQIVLMVILMFAAAAIGGSLLKQLFNRPRPFVTYAGEITAFSSAASLAFPSGHATKSVALVLPFLIFIAAEETWRKGVKIFLAILALGVCYSRVVLGAHYLSDVLAGAGLALICLPLVTLFNNKMLTRMPEKRINTALKVWIAILFVLMLYLVWR